METFTLCITFLFSQQESDWLYTLSFVSAASTQTLGLWTWPCCTDTAASSTRSSRWVSTAASPCAGIPRMQKDRCRMTQSHSRFTLWQWVNLLWDCVILFPLLLLTSNFCFLFARCHSDYILLVIFHDVQLTGRSGSTAHVHSQNTHINTDLCYVFIQHQAARLLLTVVTQDLIWHKGSRFSGPEPASFQTERKHAFTCALQPQTFPGLTRQTCKQKQNGPHF